MKRGIREHKMEAVWSKKESGTRCEKPVSDAEKKYPGAKKHLSGSAEGGNRQLGGLETQCGRWKNKVPKTG